MSGLLVLAASEGELEGLLPKCAAAVIGVGKVQSAVRSLEAIQTNRPDKVVCIGYAGSIADGLQIGDVVVGTRICQYDVDLTHFGCERCEVPTGNGNTQLGFLPLWDDPRIVGTRGAIGSADVFLTRSYLGSHQFLGSGGLGLLACDMEGFSVAYAASRFSLPVMVVRIISDDSKGHRPKSFPRFRALYQEKMRNILSVLSE